MTILPSSGSSAAPGDVDPYGNIRRASSSQSVGQVTPDGVVQDDRRATVGRIDPDGTIHRGTGHNPIGRYENGMVRDLNSYTDLARVDTPAEAAAFMLLLR
jgi:hypothetical protein